MTIIKSDKIYFEDGVKSGYLVVKDGKFAEFKTSLAQGEACIDYTGYRIIPGIIDTHNHGNMGYAMSDGLRATGKQYPDEEIEYNVRGYLKALPGCGVTGVFPTAQAGTFKIIAKIAKEEIFGTKVLGIHSEGPYMQRVGEGGRQIVYPPVDIDYVKQMIADADGMLKLFAFAPETKGIDPVIKLLKQNNVRMAFAHSELFYEETLEAIEKGITVATHLGNVMTGIHHRDIGGLGALLTSDKVKCEIICDGFHLCVPFLKILFKVRDYSGFMMISDGSELGGLKPGVYPGYYSDISMHVDENGFLLDDDGAIQGSSKSVLYGIGVLVNKVNVPIEDALRMSSLNTANWYGLGDKKGSIKLGKDADFVVIDPNYNAVATFVEGKKVYDSAKPIIFNPKFEF